MLGCPKDMSIWEYVNQLCNMYRQSPHQWKIYNAWASLDSDRIVHDVFKAAVHDEKH